MLADIHEFVQFAVDSKIQFYNECTLQMELGLFLRLKYPKLRIQLERPITQFGTREICGKKEIDICILDEHDVPFSAIEVKMPDNGRVPESMFDYCRDIRFCESLVSVGFRSASALLLTPDKAFRSGRKKDSIYAFFRGGTPLCGTVKKPTGTKQSEITLTGTYGLKWRTDHAHFAYTATEITRT